MATSVVAISHKIPVTGYLGDDRLIYLVIGSCREAPRAQLLSQAKTFQDHYRRQEPTAATKDKTLEPYDRGAKMNMWHL